MHDSAGGCVVRRNHRNRCHRHHRDNSSLQDLIEGRGVQTLRTIAKAAPCQPEDKAVHRSPAGCPAAFHVRADDGEALPETTADSPYRQAELLCDLAIGQAAEVGELDDLHVLCGQLVHRFVDRLAGHRAREVDRS
jgi:hypothetical protein